MKTINSIKAKCRGLLRSSARCGFPLLLNHKNILKLKSKYEGKRCFIVGNGPSLQMRDLQRIHDNSDVSIASNKIYLAFEETSWRPDVYTVIDTVVMENNLEIINKLPFVKIYPEGFQRYVLNDSNAMFCELGFEGNWDGTEYVDGFKPGFSMDILKNVFPGECVTYWNIQIAQYLGAKEIILLGVDFSFKIPNKKISSHDYGYILYSEGEVNHFSDKYRIDNETWTMPNLLEQKQAFDYANNFCSNNGIKIFNASRKTKLDSFEKVNFEDLF